MRNETAKPKLRKLRIRCDYCKEKDLDELPKPYGLDGFEYRNSEIIHSGGFYGGKWLNICHDCYRRGSRWHEKIRGEMLN